MINYYLLVLGTLTGLSTFLRLTEVVDASEVQDAIKVHKHPLHPAPAVLAYLERRCGSPCKIVRRFEYRFRLVGLHVIMLHFKSDDGRLHLVEVYKTKKLMALLPTALLLVGVLVAVAAVLLFPAWFYS